MLAIIVRDLNVIRLEDFRHLPNHQPIDLQVQRQLRQIKNIYIYIYIGSDTPELPLVLLALNVGLNQGLLFNLLNKGICSKPLTTVHVHHHQIGSTPGILSTFDRRYITVQT